MSRPRSAHVAEVKAALIARLHGGYAHPGGRFFSTRAVAQRFAVSYQTAHRILAELKTEGRLERVAASGSFVPGRTVTLRGVQLVFHPRAKRKGSFGARLQAMLTAELEARGIPFIRTWPESEETPRLRRDHYPIFWECRSGVHAAAANRCFALCLNDRPPFGLAGGYVDAVTTDDFSGGACAAELLKRRTGSTDLLAVLGGPALDSRSQQRIAGFRAHAPNATVICADNWFVEGGLEKANVIFRSKSRGVFACNDRLAEALILHSRRTGLDLPPLVGFDNAPVAERLRLTTIGIPWHEMVAQAVSLVTTRLAGGTTPAKLICLAHEPILRLTS